MSYVDKTLLPNEIVIYRAKLHWLPLMWPFTFAAPIIMAIGVGCIVTAAPALIILGSGLNLIGLLLIIQFLILRFCTEFAVTNKRLIFKTGFIIRDVLELQLRKTEAIAFLETFWGRIFGYGTIAVTTGEASNVYRCVRKPLAFRRAISMAVDMYA